MCYRFTIVFAAILYAVLAATFDTVLAIITCRLTALCAACDLGLSKQFVSTNRVYV